MYPSRFVQYDPAHACVSTIPRSPVERPAHAPPPALVAAPSTSAVCSPAAASPDRNAHGVPDIFTGGAWILRLAWSRRYPESAVP